MPSYYAPAAPAQESSKSTVASYTAEFFTVWLEEFLDAIGVDQAVIVGHSFGGLVALRFALAAPERVTALAVAGSSGLGTEVNPALRPLLIPGYGELLSAYAMTPIGNAQRLWTRSALMFADARRAPAAWLREQTRLALVPQFLLATLAVLRGLADLNGQRPEAIVVERLPELPMRTLVIWGADDRIVPVEQARRAVTRLQHGQLAVLPDCGHIPQLECPDRFAATLQAFLAA